MTSACPPRPTQRAAVTYFAGLQAGAWARYTDHCVNGGYFDLTVRAASAAGGGKIRLIALDQTLASVDIPATGGADAFRDFTIPGVYLNPGELSMLVFVDVLPARSLTRFRVNAVRESPHHLCGLRARFAAASSG